ncbi:MAG: hypothetical protein VB027_09725 [Gordonibacter sp.]|nr:hypothetical protein [Gordonibacter sp.]
MAINIIEHNPMLKKPLLAVLSAVDTHTPTSRSKLEASLLGAWSNEYAQSPSVSIDILARSGALSEHLCVNGEPYNGTLEDLQCDENIDEDVEVEVQIFLTDEGSELIKAYTPLATLQTLIASKPLYRSVFETILRACNTETGCSCADLERTLAPIPQLQPHPETQQTAVYPQYFIDALESAGGIFWKQSWFTTDAGKTVITV